LPDLDRLAVELSQIEDAEVARDVSAADYCTYRVGGSLAVLVEVGSADALSETAAVLSGSGVETLALGRGSNLLVADRGFDGVVVHPTGLLSDVEVSETKLRAGAAALLPVVARASVAAGLTGFEWAVGVPGSIGGAVRMNAGGHGSDMAATLESVEIADFRLGGILIRSAESLELGYRHSNIGSGEIVVSATFRLEQGRSDARSDLLTEIVTWRRENQPGGANAGSVFRNPPGVSAGELIESVGAKGLRVGSAEVSEKHANFIQVDPQGSADDVLRLMSEVVALVAAEHGVRLHAETHLVGFTPEEIGQVQHVDPQAEQD